MNFVVGLVLYIILFLMILGVTWRFGIHLFSAVTVAALVSAVFLIILIPPSKLDKYTDDMIDGYDNHKSTNDAAVAVVCIILVITLILVIWYVLCKAYGDRVSCGDIYNSCERY
ncbi:unnamed protein product [marine sediment metagenome]|uniref:Uncharacterized protein n=1 Tax=marine sediment metagenome TaxID=412755 RepID=X1C412_9ZZZZ